MLNSKIITFVFYHLKQILYSAFIAEEKFSLYSCTIRAVGFFVVWTIVLKQICQPLLWKIDQRKQTWAQLPGRSGPCKPPKSPSTLCVFPVCGRGCGCCAITYVSRHGAVQHRANKYTQNWVTGQEKVAALGMEVVELAECYSARVPGGGGLVWALWFQQRVGLGNVWRENECCVFAGV